MHGAAAVATEGTPLVTRNGSGKQPSPCWAMEGRPPGTEPAACPHLLLLANATAGCPPFDAQASQPHPLPRTGGASCCLALEAGRPNGALVPGLPDLQWTRRLLFEASHQGGGWLPKLPAVPQHTMPHQSCGRQQLDEQPLEHVRRHSIADLLPELAFRDVHLEVFGGHTLEAHHLSLGEPARAVGHPMAATAAASQAGAQVLDVFHPGARTVTVHYPRFFERVVAFGVELLESPTHIGKRRALAHRREVDQRGPLLPGFQEILNAGPWHWLWELEGAIIPCLVDPYEVDAPAALRHALLFGVQEL